MKQYQVVGIGNAVVDVISQSDDSFLDLMGIQKGIMQLVEKERGEMLYGAMTNRKQAPGGSVANTLAGLGALGLSTGFIGRVSDDALGQFYAQEMQADGTDFVNEPVAGDALPTSRSMIFVSPDGERSMNTYLGISAEVGPDDVRVRAIRMAWVPGGAFTRKSLPGIGRDESGKAQPGSDLPSYYIARQETTVAMYADYLNDLGDAGGWNSRMAKEDRCGIEQAGSLGLGHVMPSHAIALVLRESPGAFCGPDDGALANGRKLGQRVAELVKKLA